ncbi:hypothetical protein D1825_13575 [Cellulomonas rhizosphaerae]|uniref:Uncharacterized protein n=1 Tax=Cellulomonas rhizosphaerae TaxID=2293719 RepID=A0A413RJ59_9CELL|nr:hypothetical protein D1825_13575 [Cellulomonas rhizosphaerae]
MLTGLAAAAPAQAADGATRVVVTATVARARPATSSTVKKRLKRMDRVVVTSTRGSWARTSTGWVPAKTLARANHYADTVAAQHGLRIVYTNKQACGTRASVSTATAFQAGGCYVAGSNDLQLTKSAAYDGKATWKRTAIRNLVLHESAHALIWRAVGSAHPALAGSRSEQVTDAYAWKYLGATSRTAGGYGFSAKDLAAAKAIRAKG